MAGTQSGADFLLSVGVDVGLSYTQFQQDLPKLVNAINKNPPKIKVALDIDNATLTNFRNQIAELTKSLNTKGVISVTSDTSGVTSNTASVQSNTSAVKSNTAAKVENTYADRVLSKENKAALTSYNQITNSLKKWTAAEHSRNAASRTAYATLTATVDNLDRLRTGYINGTVSVQELANATLAANIQLKNTQGILVANGDATKTWSQRVGGLAEKFNTWFSISQIIMAAYRALRQMIGSVVELDTAMTELKKVTDETDARYTRFLQNAIVRAKTLGAALSDVVTASADFARLGFNIDEAEKLADAAIVYKNVGDGIEDISDASESIIATMQAFSIEAKDVMSIVDKFNEVGNNYAISSKGVGDALLRSAAAMRAANNSLDETIALATASNTIVQDPEKVGTTLKTVSMYLRAAKTEADDAGESTEGMANSVSELRAEILALTGNKVDIQLNEDEFKSTYQILKELSGFWKDLSDISQANILEMVGGKRNSNVVAALLENFEIAEKTVQTSADSTGSALSENEKVLESIQGRINKFKATFESMANSVIGSGLVKTFIDIGTVLLNIITWLSKIPFILTTIIAIVNTIKGVKAFKTMGLEAAQAAATVNSLSSAIMSNVTAKTSEIAADGALAASVAALSAAEKEELVTSIQRMAASKGLSAAQTEQILLAYGLTTATTTAAAAEGVATVATKGLTASIKALLASNPIGWILLAVSAIIEIISVISSLSDSVEDTTEKFNELKNTIQSTKNELESSISSVNSIKDEYALLAQGVDAYGNNVSLTDEEYEKFIQHNNQLAKQFPTLVKGYNSNGVAILSLAGGVQEITYAIDKLIESMQSTANLTLLKSAETDYKTIYGQVKNLKDEITALKDEAAALPITVERAAGEITQQDYSKAFRTGAEAIYYQRELAAKGISSTITENVQTKLEGDVYPQMYTIVAASIEDVQAYELKQAEALAAKANTEYQALISQIETKQNELESAVSQFDDYINAYLSSVGNGGFNFAKIESSMGDVGTLIVHSLIDNLDMTKYDDVEAFYDAIDEILLKVKKVGDAENWGAIQDSIKKITDAGDSLTFTAFTDEYNNLIQLLKDSGISQDVIDELTGMFNYKDIKGNVSKVKNMVKDEYDNLVDGLSLKDINTAIKYKIGAENNSLTWDEFLQKIKEATPIKTSIEVYTNVNALSSGFEQLDKIFSDIYDKEDFDWSSILNNQDFEDLFGNLDKYDNAYTDFINTIANSPTDINACRSAFNELATAFVINSGVLDDVTDETRNVTVAMLKQMGVANAAAIVDRQLAYNKEYLKYTTGDYVDMTYEEILALYNEYEAGSVTQQVLAELAISKMMANENGIKTSSDIDQLIALANTANATTASLNNLAQAKALMAKAESYKAISDQAQKDGDGYNFQKNLAAAQSYLSQANKLLNQPLSYNTIDPNKFKVNYTGGSSTRSAQSSAAKSAEKAAKDVETWFEIQLRDHQHRVAMEKETEEDYLKWLNVAYQQAYAEGIIEIDDYYKYQEEVYEGLRDLVRDYLNDVEHEISMRENYDGESKKIIQLYNGLIKKVEKEIADARAQGLTDEDEYIQELQEKWMDYTNAVKDIKEEITDAAKDALDEMIDYRVDMLKQEIEDEKDALDKKLDNLKEFYDKQKEMLEKQHEEEQYLEDQAEKRKSVSDIKADLAMLENDDSAWAQKRKLELSEELSEAEKDLADFEKENALDKALEAIDNAYNSQEAQLQREMDALDEKLNDPQALFNQALEDIRNNSKNQLYYQMLEYNRKYGDGNDETVKKLWEDTYGALNEYEQLFGKLYKGVDLKNETGKKDEDGWDKTTVSGTNPDNKPKETPKTNTTTTPKSTAPSLSKGSSIQVKKSATHFGSKSNGVKMASFVPGGTYTVYQTSGNQVLIGRSGVYTGWIKKSDIVGYASGTKHATQGLHELYEQGSEALFVSSSGNKYRMLSDGDKVFNAKATDFLYDFANGEGDVLAKMLKNVFGSTLLDDITPTVITNEINMGNIIVQGSATEQTVSEIRRAQRSNVEFMLREFTKLNK